jgi:hypothetical protein
MCFCRDEAVDSQGHLALQAVKKQELDLKMQAVSMVSSSVLNKRISSWHGPRSDPFRDQERGQIATIGHAF